MTVKGNLKQSKTKTYVASDKAKALVIAWWAKIADNPVEININNSNKVGVFQKNKHGNSETIAKKVGI